MNFAGEWMAHKLDLIDSALGVPLLFEGKNRKQQIDVAFDAARAIRTPGPKLWTDVVDHFQAATVQRAGQFQIEVGPVNENYRVGLSFNRCLLQKICTLAKTSAGRRQFPVTPE